MTTLYPLEENQQDASSRKRSKPTNPMDTIISKSDLEPWEDPSTWTEEKIRRRIKQEQEMIGLAVADNDPVDAHRRMDLVELYTLELKSR